MIIEKQTEANIVKEGESQESIGMSLDLDSAQILMQMLSKNLYSDSIGSTVRECASNALDSHRRAGVDKPIVVSFKPIGGQYEFSVEDFGVGLDADDVKNIISKYGKSTKRNSATELGMMGLGFKAPLAYSSSFYFICRKDSVERKYMMYEGEDTNTIDLLYEKATKEGNGVKVIIPVKYGDRREFYSKIQEQLAYFQNVYFDCEDNIDNNFIIYRNDLFQFSQLATDSNLHICLDDVYYPIDFNKIGINSLNFPIALKFGLSDGIFPTPNRESIRYTKEAKETILKKIGDVADYFVKKYNETISDSDDLDAILRYYDNSSKLLDWHNKHLDISGISQYSKLSFTSPKLKGVELLNLERLYKMRDYIFCEFEKKFTYDHKRFRQCKTSYSTRLNWNRWVNVSDIYKYDDKLSIVMKDWIKANFDSSKSYIFVKKVNSFKLGNYKSQEYKTYHQLLGLGSKPKSQWRQLIKEFHIAIGTVTDKFQSLDAVEIPQSFRDRKKKAKVVISASGVKTRRIKLQGEMNGKIATSLERTVDGQSCKFVPILLQMNELYKRKSLMVYGKEADKKQMDSLFRSFKNNVEFVILSDREFNNMQKVNLHNWKTMEEFMKGDSKPFKRIATAYLIDRLNDKYTDTFVEDRNIVKDVSTDLFDKILILEKYRDLHSKYSDSDVISAIIEMAEANQLYDMEIYPIYKDVKNILERLPFINVICEASNGRKYNGEESIKWKLVMTDLFKYHRQKVNWQNYKIKLNDEIVTPITDEIMEQS
jgi:anti-sigma regulatory factor (Ser/Thr protein kinase)